MAFSTTITITGDTNISSFDIYQCTSSGCTNCIAITGSTGENVSRQKLLTGHTVTVSGEPYQYPYIKIEPHSGSCENSICIPILGTPTPTATPVPPTATPLPTSVSPTATPVSPTATPVVTSGQSPTATPITPTATPVSPTATPVPPTATPVPPTATPMPTSSSDCNINGNTSVSVATPSATGTITLTNTGNIMEISIFGGATTGGSNSVTLTVSGTGGTPTPNPNSVSVTASAFQSNNGTLILPTSGTYSYTFTMSAVGTSGHSAGFGCGDPYISPTPTPTEAPIVYVYYRAAEVLDSQISTTYCNNFGSGGQGFTINSPFYTTDAILTAGTTTIYSDYGLTTPVVGSWALDNVTRMAYITESENNSATNTPTTTNPNGDLLYDGGLYKFMRVNSNGGIISLGNDSCSGGPSGPSEA